jgi:hypothetical protein
MNTIVEIIRSLGITDHKKITLGRINHVFVGILNDEKVVIKINIDNTKIINTNR